jgi:hypothetical protein
MNVAFTKDNCSVLSSEAGNAMPLCEAPTPLRMSEVNHLSVNVVLS